MTWNWQRPDWPSFSFDAPRLVQAERAFLRGAGVFIGSVEHLEFGERERVLVESMVREAVTTSAIEGEALNRESVQSSLMRALGLDAPTLRVRPQERGIAEVLVDLYRRPTESLTHERLCDWHRRIMAGAMAGGSYRAGPEPMRIVSGRAERPHVHFEAPPSSRVRAEMGRFLDWFAGTEHQTGILARAGIAHLYFESIHPFEDGNGRVGRAVAELALAQGAGRAFVSALSPTMLRHRREYYEALARASTTNRVTDWLAWFAGAALEGQSRALALVEFTIDKARFLARFAPLCNPRQAAALRRVLDEGPDGFEGGLSARKYIAITGASTATTTRDLSGLVEMGAANRVGEKRATRYVLNVAPRPVGHVRVDESGGIVQDGRKD